MMLLSRRGQSGIEMLISIAFVLFLVVIIALFASQRNSEADQLKLRIDAKSVASSLADNINNIAEQGPGFYRYFTLPETLYGITEYNISIYQDYVEVSTENYTWSTQTISPNITVYCLDKNPFKRNKVFDESDKISIICNKPELRYVNGSMWLTYLTNATLWPPYAHTNQSLNLTIKIMNYGPERSGPFWVRFNKTTTQKINPIGADEAIETPPYTLTTPPSSGPLQISVEIDYNNSVNESIETNNAFNITINVTDAEIYAI